MDHNNFFFLSYNWRILYLVASQAELYLYSDPHSTKMKLRVFAETMLREIINSEGIRSEFKFDKMLKNLYSTGALSEEVKSSFSELQYIGNTNTHVYNDAIESALMSLKAAHKIANWFYQKYDSPQHQMASFVLPNKPDQVSKQDLEDMQKRILELERDLERTRQQIQEHPSPVNSSLYPTLQQKKLNKSKRYIAVLTLIFTSGTLIIFLMLILWNEKSPLTLPDVQTSLLPTTTTNSKKSSNNTLSPTLTPSSSSNNGLNSTFDTNQSEATNIDTTIPSNSPIIATNSEDNSSNSVLSEINTNPTSTPSSSSNNGLNSTTSTEQSAITKNNVAIPSNSSNNESSSTSSLPIPSKSLTNEEVKEQKEKINEYLFQSAKSGNKEKVIEAISKGADVNYINTPDIWGETPLYIATLNNNPDVVEILLMNGANPNISTAMYSDYPLVQAVKIGSVDMTKALLNKGANPNVNEGKEELPPIIRAARKQNIEIVKLLIEAKANVNIIGHGGTTALADALTNYKVVKLLLEAGADPTIKDNYGHSAYYTAKHTYWKNKDLIDLIEVYVPENERINYIP